MISENKRTWKDGQILGSCQRTEKAVEHEVDSKLIVVDVLGMVL